MQRILMPLRNLTIRYDSVYLTCSKKLTVASLVCFLRPVYSDTTQLDVELSGVVSL